MKFLFTDPIFFGRYDAEGIIFVLFYAALCGLFLVSFFLRGVYPFNNIWGFFKWVIIMLLLTLSVNFVKKSLKDWWNKD